MVGTASLSDVDVQALIEEQEQFNDMGLMDGVKEDWRNLTGKLLESIAWGLNNIAPFDYIMKVDDDSYVRLDYLMKDLVLTQVNDTNKVLVACE